MPRFQLPRVLKVHPKVLLGDMKDRKDRRDTAFSHVNPAGVEETEQVSGPAGDSALAEEISQKIADLDVMVEGAPQRVFGAYLLNIDASLFAQSQQMSHIKTVIEALHMLRRPVRFLSVTSSVSSQKFIAAMAREGIEIEPSQIVTPGKLASAYFARSYPGAQVYLIGDEALQHEMQEAGIAITADPRQANVVFVAMDREFSYAKLNDAFIAVTENGADVVTSSLRRLCRNADGTSAPGVLPLVTAIEIATRSRVTKNLGSPATDLLDLIFEDLPAKPEHSLLVTDSLGADIRMAKRFGIPSALVVTSEEMRDKARERKRKDQPNYVLNSIADIIPTYIKDQI
ncbi:HAD hydrolase-like protein [Trueperella sp. LYQ143]|uniref:HAD hydrolase-like protein n=1 Tax=unclassified Trueperella TaxID=2630174 RepID=UPI0039830F83